MARVVPIRLPFTGAVVEPGRLPAQLIDNAPGPVHGRPVSGFVPDVFGMRPVGSAGETLSSDRACKSVLCPLSTGLAVFWASAAVADRMMAPWPINATRSATMVDLPPESAELVGPHFQRIKARRMSALGGDLKRSTQHFISDVRDGGA
jgi:hypothetical protein